jgi:hypothetical protein
VFRKQASKLREVSYFFNDKMLLLEEIVNEVEELPMQVSEYNKSQGVK